MHRGEVLLRDGVAVGDVRSASYGHTLGGAVGLAQVRHPLGGRVDREWLEGARQWEVDIAGRRHPARISLAPLYDPRNERVK
jgi:4-methylaminobutanoate oxidase (formaldehyde-forming)